jgi:hypothetical protein
MHRVQYLAVELDHEWEANVDYHSEPEGRIIKLISYFCGLKRLTLVVEHYDTELENFTNTSLIDAIDVNQAFSIHESSYDHPRYEYQDMPEDWQNSDMGLVSFLDMDHIKKINEETPGHGYWKFPITDFKVAVADSVRRELE